MEFPPVIQKVGLETVALFTPVVWGFPPPHAEIEKVVPENELDLETLIS
jgi:hypothetical protein